MTSTALLFLIMFYAGSDNAKSDYSGIIKTENQVFFTPEVNINSTSIKEPVKPRDPRAIRLERFLKTQLSPLQNHADLLVELSDQYNIDYKLVVAIAGVESGYCNVNFRPNNCWGYGNYSWGSLEIGIREYYRLFHRHYFAKGYDTLSEIVDIYNPYPENYIAKVSKFIDRVP